MVQSLARSLTKFLFCFYQTYLLFSEWHKTESIEFNKMLCPNKSNWALIRLLPKLILHCWSSAIFSNNSTKQPATHVPLRCTIDRYCMSFSPENIQTMSKINSIVNIMIVVASNMSKLPTEFANPIRFYSMYFMCYLMIFQKPNVHKRRKRS